MHQEKGFVYDFLCVHADVLGLCCGLVVKVRGFLGVERCYIEKETEQRIMPTLPVAAFAYEA